MALASFLVFALYRVALVYRFDLEGECMVPASRPAQEPSPLPSLAALRVVSYNIAGHTALVRPGHVAQIGALIQGLEADVVGLQEVHRGTWQSRWRDQVAELERTTGLAAAFGPSFRVLGGEFGNAVLVRGTVLDSEVLPLPSFGEPRSVLRVRVEVRGSELEVFVTHLTAWGGVNRAARGRQLRCLGEHLRAAGRPFVLAGDFNAPPQTPEVAALLRGDLAQLCGVREESTHSLLDRRLDYLLADPRFRVVQGRVLRRGPSDHWPLVAELAPAGEPPSG